MRWRAAGGFFLFVAILGVGCSSGGRPTVAAVVEGIKIPSSETEALLKTYENSAVGARDDSAGGGDHKAKIRFVLLYQIKHAFLRHLADSLGVPASAGAAGEDEAVASLAQTDPGGFQAAGMRPGDLAEAMTAGRVSKALAEKVFPDDPPTDEALHKEFDARRTAYQGSWHVAAKVASFDSAEKAGGVAPKVQGGQAFADAASAAGAADVGNVDVTPLSPLPKAVLDAVGKLHRGEVSAPIQVSTGGWASIFVEQREELPPLSFEQVRAELTRDLADRQRQQLFETWFAKQLRAARIQVSGHYGRWDASQETVR